jgi:hypothetical protein
MKTMRETGTMESSSSNPIPEVRLSLSPMIKNIAVNVEMPDSKQIWVRVSGYNVSFLELLCILGFLEVICYSFLHGLS